MGGSFWKLIIILVVAMLLVSGAYNLLKKYVFSRFKPIKGLKWIMFVASLLSIVFDSFLGNKYGSTSVPYIAGMVLFMLCLVSTFDLFGLRGSENGKNNNNKKNIVIKPKAKPNRVKKKSNE